MNCPVRGYKKAIRAVSLRKSSPTFQRCTKGSSSHLSVLVVGDMDDSVAALEGQIASLALEKAALAAKVTFLEAANIPQRAYLQQLTTATATLTSGEEEDASARRERLLKKKIGELKASQAGLTGDIARKAAFLATNAVAVTLPLDFTTAHKSRFYPSSKQGAISPRYTRSLSDDSLLSLL